MEQDYLNIKRLVEIPDKVDGYPAPTPPRGRKADIFHISDYTWIDRRAKEAPEDIAMTWDGLITYLFKDLTTDLQKLRALFSWLGKRDFPNPQYYTSKEAPVGSPYALLGQVETEYLYLLNSYFAQLCRHAGLPCVVLDGNSKRVVSYSVGDKDGSKFRSIWTAVYVDGSWRLVYPVSAFSGVTPGTSDYILIEDCGQAVRKRTDGEATLVKHVNERFFLMDPDEAIYTDFPKGDEAWQLLDEPWSFDKFLTSPCFAPAYFQSPWKLGTKYKSIVEAPEGRCCITFDEVPEGSDFKYRLYFNEVKSESKLPEELQLTRYIIPTKKSVRTRLPVTGIYKLEILTKYMSGLCEVRIDSTGDIKNQTPFPEIPDIGFGFKQEAISAGLEDPSHDDGLVLAQEGEKVCFKFRMRKPLQAQARLVHNWLASHKLEGHVTQEQEDDMLTIVVKVPYEPQNPEFSLLINVRKKDSDDLFVNVVNYLLTHDKDLVYADKDLVYADKGPEEQAHDELIAAITGQDLHRLENALKEFRLSGGKMGSKNVTEAYAKLYHLHSNAIQAALTSQNQEELSAVLKEADQSGARYLIQRSDVYGQAKNAMHRS